MVTIFNCVEWPGRTWGEGSQSSKDQFPGLGSSQPRQFPVCQRRAEGHGMGRGGGGAVFPYSWKVLQHFEEEKEEIFSSAQAQPSCQLFFLLGWDRAGWWAGGNRRRKKNRVGGQGVALTGQDVLKILPVCYPPKNWPLNGCWRALWLPHIYSIWQNCGTQFQQCILNEAKWNAFLVHRKVLPFFFFFDIMWCEELVLAEAS